MNETEEDNQLPAFFQLSEVRLYTVCGIIAALVLLSIIQIICTMYKTRKTTANQKVSVCDAMCGRRLQATNLARNATIFIRVITTFITPFHCSRYS